MKYKFLINKNPISFVYKTCTPLPDVTDDKINFNHWTFNYFFDDRPKKVITNYFFRVNKFQSPFSLRLLLVNFNVNRVSIQVSTLLKYYLFYSKFTKSFNLFYFLVKVSIRGLFLSNFLKLKTIGLKKQTNLLVDNL
jgi:hypothetical protein